MKKKRGKSSKNRLVTAVVANQNGEIFELDGYAAVGMAGPTFTPLTVGGTSEMPHGGELMLLPDRKPVLYNISENRLETPDGNPYAPDEPIFPVAVFNSPGYVAGHIAAFKEKKNAKSLPLFSYGAAGWDGNGFRTAVILVDREKRQDLRFMKREDVVRGIKRMRKIMPANRLRAHLENCAMKYGCPAGKNFFLKRYEAPLPTSGHCNSRCLGCISLQDDPDIPNSQDRISFKPSPDEIAEVALEHIKNVKKSVVSFGQGCEGDPLMAADAIEPAIRKIRAATSGGTINLNTNASIPKLVGKLFDAGLDSMRVSMNSVRKACYDAYYRPVGYRFSDVVKSIDIGIGKGGFVSVNYLNCPGFTDTPGEIDALIDFIGKHPIHMIQWRNLNFDPIRYWKAMETASPSGNPVGMKKTLNTVRRAFPNLIFGYFNPPREKFDGRQDNFSW